jgi:hypothetical protein
MAVWFARKLDTKEPQSSLLRRIIGTISGGSLNATNAALAQLAAFGREG